jgi:transcription elongation factor GreA
MNETLITPAGLARLSEHLDRLKTEGREAVARRLRDAFTSDADPSSNADYLAAREEQAMLERRIAELDRRLDGALVAEADGANGVVDVGERVRLRDLDSGRRVAYELVGSLEADPAAGRVSIESPLGRALLGRRRGETVAVDAPKGTLRYKITGIEAAGRAA